MIFISPAAVWTSHVEESEEKKVGEVSQRPPRLWAVKDDCSVPPRPPQREGGREGHMRATTREREKGGRKEEDLPKDHCSLAQQPTQLSARSLARPKNMASFAAVIGAFVHEWRDSEDKQLGKMLRRRFALSRWGMGRA